MSLNLGIIASSRGVAAPPAALLLDTYPGAAGAYSLRKLRTAYTGAAIRVRRSSDNTESDIGFNGGGGLDTTAISTFVGANNGFITKWYDQSGNAKDATQSTTTLQPRIVNSGVIYTKNSKPSVFIGASDTAVLNLSSNFTGTAGTLINLTATITDLPTANNGSPMGCIGEINNGCHQPYQDGTIYETFATNNRRTVGNPTPNTTNLYLYNVISIFGTYNVKINNSTFYNHSINTVFYNTSSTVFPQIGNGFGGFQNYYFHGYITEIIIYTSNQTTNISGINSNLNSYYTIY